MLLFALFISILQVLKSLELINYFKIYRMLITENANNMCQTSIAEMILCYRTGPTESTKCSHDSNNDILSLSSFSANSVAHDGIHNANNAFNKIINEEDQWLSRNFFDTNCAMPNWLQITLPYKIELSSYTVYAHPGCCEYNFQNPRSWELQGSNDGASWTTIDTRSSQVFNNPLPNTYNNPTSQPSSQASSQPSSQPSPTSMPSSVYIPSNIQRSYPFYLTNGYMRLPDWAFLKGNVINYHISIVLIMLCY